MTLHLHQVGHLNTHTHTHARRQETGKVEGREQDQDRVIRRQVKRKQYRRSDAEEGR